MAFADADGDGWAACVDCDDEVAAIHPGAVEVCDGADNDCDDVADGADALDAVPFYLDNDSDGFGLVDEVIWGCTAPEGYVADGTDCDDEDDTAYPGADEECDGDDDDCDGVVDDDPVETSGALYYQDLDRDGVGHEDVAVRACEQPAGFAASPGDCDDLEARAYPGADEVCDGVDNDCNDEVDDDADDAPTWYADEDGDGYGDAPDSTAACSQPVGYVRDG